LALPSGAHFQTASAIQTRVLPLNDWAKRCRRVGRDERLIGRLRVEHRHSGAPAVARADVAAGVRGEREHAGAVAAGVAPGKLRPRPTSTPSSTYWSIGASQASWTPSSPYCVPSIAWYASGLSTKSQVCACCD
jgi:hypothetical protein